MVRMILVAVLILFQSVFTMIAEYQYPTDCFDKVPWESFLVANRVLIALAKTLPQTYQAFYATSSTDKCAKDARLMFAILMYIQDADIEDYRCPVLYGQHAVKLLHDRNPSTFPMKEMPHQSIIVEDAVEAFFTFRKVVDQYLELVALDTEKLKVRADVVSTCPVCKSHKKETEHDFLTLQPAHESISQIWTRHTYQSSCPQHSVCHFEKTSFFSSAAPNQLFIKIPLDHKLSKLKIERDFQFQGNEYHLRALITDRSVITVNRSSGINLELLEVKDKYADWKLFHDLAAYLTSEQEQLKKRPLLLIYNSKNFGELRFRKPKEIVKQLSQKTQTQAISPKNYQKLISMLSRKHDWELSRFDQDTSNCLAQNPYVLHQNIMYDRANNLAELASKQRQEVDDLRIEMASWDSLSESDRLVPYYKKLLELDGIIKRLVLG